MSCIFNLFNCCNNSTAPQPSTPKSSSNSVTVQVNLLFEQNMASPPASPPPPFRAPGDHSPAQVILTPPMQEPNPSDIITPLPRKPPFGSPTFSSSQGPRAASQAMPDLNLQTVDLEINVPVTISSSASAETQTILGQERPLGLSSRAASYAPPLPENMTPASDTGVLISRASHLPLKSFGLGPSINGRPQLDTINESKGEPSPTPRQRKITITVDHVQAVSRISVDFS